MSTELIQKLALENNRNNINLAKWIVALDTGVIIFASNIAGNLEGGLLRALTFIAMLSLAFSLFRGVNYVKLGAEFGTANLERALNIANRKSASSSDQKIQKMQDKQAILWDQIINCFYLGLFLVAVVSVFGL
nr:hypothetical protein 3 [bacterium]